MIVKPTVTELLTKTENRFKLVIATSKRARQLIAGAKPMVNSKGEKPLSVAVEELNQGKIKILTEEEAASLNAEE